MNNETELQIVFSDGELLSYGARMGFRENEELCMLYSGEISDEASRVEALLEGNPDYRGVFDYALQSLMYPKNTVRICAAALEGNVIRLRAARPAALDEQFSDYGLYISAGEGGIISAADEDTLSDMIREFSGFNPEGGQAPLELKYDPLALLALIAACDAVTDKNAPPERYFSEDRLLNAFDLSRGTAFAGPGSFLGEVAGTEIYSVLNGENIAAAAALLLESGVFEDPGISIEGKKLFAFSRDFYFLPGMFMKAENLFAYICRNVLGELRLGLVATAEDETWAFMIDNGKGSIKRFDSDSFGKFLLSLTGDFKIEFEEPVRSDSHSVPFVTAEAGSAENRLSEQPGTQAKSDAFRFTPPSKPKRGCLRPLAIVFAVIALAFAGLLAVSSVDGGAVSLLFGVYNPFSAVSLGDGYISRKLDENTLAPVEKVTGLYTSDKIAYYSCELKKAPKGTRFDFIWYYNGAKVSENSVTLSEDVKNRYVASKLPAEPGLPHGNYEVVMTATRDGKTEATSKTSFKVTAR